jgi:hypothetical protein
VHVDQLIVGRELSELAEAVASRDVVADPAVGRQLERLVSAVQRLLDEHSLDARGRCRACGRKRGCPVRTVLSDYAGSWLAGPRPSAARHAADRRRGGDLPGPGMSD